MLMGINRRFVEITTSEIRQATVVSEQRHTYELPEEVELPLDWRYMTDEERISWVKSNAEWRHGVALSPDVRVVSVNDETAQKHINISVPE